MSTTLCFDFGNTRMKCAVFTGGEFVREHVLEDDREETIGRLLVKYHPDRSILSSVIRHNPAMEDILKEKLISIVWIIVPESPSLRLSANRRRSARTVLRWW